MSSILLSLALIRAIPFPVTPRLRRVASSSAAALRLEDASLLPLGSLLCYQRVAVFGYG